MDNKALPRGLASVRHGPVISRLFNISRPVLNRAVGRGLRDPIAKVTLYDPTSRPLRGEGEFSEGAELYIFADRQVTQFAKNLWCIKARFVPSDFTYFETPEERDPSAIGPDRMSHMMEAQTYVIAENLPWAHKEALKPRLVGSHENLSAWARNIPEQFVRSDELQRFIVAAGIYGEADIKKVKTNIPGTERTNLSEGPGGEPS